MRCVHARALRPAHAGALPLRQRASGPLFPRRSRIREGWCMSEPMTGTATKPLLAVRGVSKHFVVGANVLGGGGSLVRALDDVWFEVPHGITVGLVGESGCGKTTMGHTIMGGHSANGGEIVFDDPALG